MSRHAEKSPALPRGFLRQGDHPARRVYVRPLGPARLERFHFSEVRIFMRLDDGVRSVIATTEAALDWAWSEGEDLGGHVARVIGRLQKPLPVLPGLPEGRAAIMGVVNVTPDSFSDGGDFSDPEAAIAHGLRLMAEGADIIDVGGESTRPGAAPTSPAEEAARVVPVVRALVGAGARVSIDSRRARVIEAALAAGARLINDVTALTHDPDALGVAAAAGVPVILMHMRGEPGTMQDAPQYDHPVLDVYDYLQDRLAACLEAGMPRERIALDVGIGFGKNDAHNTAILHRLDLYAGLGCPLCLGVSRKSMIGRLAKIAAPKDRLPGSLAAALYGVMRGARILRVHDVAATRQALAIWEAIENG